MSEPLPPESAPIPPLAVAPLSDRDQRLWATLIPIGGIFFHFLPALFGYVLLRDRGDFIREHSRNALNFQLTVLVGYAVGIFTTWLIIGFVILAAVAVLNIIFSILAAIAANRGDHYRYPVAIPFVS